MNIHDKRDQFIDKYLHSTECIRDLGSLLDSWYYSGVECGYTKGYDDKEKEIGNDKEYF